MEKNDVLCFSFINSGLAGMTNETIDRILLKHLLPQNLNVSRNRFVWSFYKLSILIVLFIQTFRYEAEPFFFVKKKRRIQEKYTQR